MSELGIIADRQNNRMTQPPNLRTTIVDKKNCECCENVESYDEDRKYYCFKHHRRVEMYYACNDFKSAT